MLIHLKSSFLLLILTTNFLTNASAKACQRLDADKIIVQTKNGKIKGNCNTVKINDEDHTKFLNVYSWLSIPYAQPPTQNLRFKAPQPVKSWPNIIDGSKIPNSCMQIPNPNNNMWSIPPSSSSKLSEDCLYLNVYLSDDTFNKMGSADRTNKAPILVYFHGGGGTVGSGILDVYNPSVFVGLTNIIVVTINYRLDVLGFLHLNDNENELVEGNQGILDQSMALKWVYENADVFGGDSSKITIMGQSAGSRFVGYHLVYQPSWAYFRNAILLSGSPTNVARNAISSQTATKRARQFLKEALNCPDKKLIECARKIDGYNLTASSRAFLSRDMTSGNGFAATFLLSAFVPVVDGKNLKETPMRSFRTGRYKMCNIITGFTSQDGTSLIPFSYGAVDDSKVPKTPNPKNNIKQIITYPLLANFLKNYYSFFPTWPYKLDEIILNSILNEYTKLTHKNFEDSRLVKSNYFYTLSKILSDETYICPAFKLANYIENKVKVYLYAYNYRISTNRMPFWYGIVHGEELAMVFGHPLNDFENSRNYAGNIPWLVNSTFVYPVSDKKMSKQIINYLANFIRDDNPNSKLDTAMLNWPEYKLPVELPEYNEVSQEKTDSLYLAIRTNGTQVTKALNLDACYLWNNLIPANLDSLGKS